MPDKLSALLSRYPLRSRVIHSGALASVLNVHQSPNGSCLHLLCSGQLELVTVTERFTFNESSVVMLPRSVAHQLIPTSRLPELVSAEIDFGPHDENPLLRGLPDLLHVAISQMQPDGASLAPVQQLLICEAAAQRCGHLSVVDRLVEVLVIQALRHAMAMRLVDVGVLAGLADPRLARVLNALHAEPGRPWTLNAMADLAGMSRARFAVHFSAALGTSPGDYLSTWRIGLTRSLLRQGLSLKQVASEVGYANSSALSRAFTQRVGQPPREWLAQALQPSN